MRYFQNVVVAAAAAAASFALIVLSCVMEIRSICTVLCHRAKTCRITKVRKNYLIPKLWQAIFEKGHEKRKIQNIGAQDSVFKIFENIT